MNNSENDYTIRCSRCGEDMKSSSRYCMKCGNLNSNHPENQNMIPYIKDNIETYTVGDDGFLRKKKTGSIVLIGTNTGSKKLCFIINLLVYLLFIGISFLSNYLSVGDITKILDTSFPIMLTCCSFSFFYIYSYEILFMKMNKRWWAVFIPIYNLFVLSSALFNRGWMGILFLIPGINFIMIFYALYVLAKKFKVIPLFTILLPFIAIPYLGLSSKIFNDTSYVNIGENALEKEYKLRKSFMSLTFFFLLVGILLSLYTNMDKVEVLISNFDSYIYKYSANSYLNKVKDSIESGKIECEGDAPYADLTEYYVYSSELSYDIYVPLQTFRDKELSAYVRVEKNNGDTNYYVSISDGEKGIKESLSDNITVDSVEDMDSINKENFHSVVCYLK